MPADISGGGTGIFINGREIHPLDQLALMQLFGVTYQGNFWMDAQGNLGYVGGPPIANIFQAAQAKQAGGRASGGSATHGYDSTNGGRGTSAGGYVLRSNCKWKIRFLVSGDVIVYALLFLIVL